MGKQVIQRHHICYKPEVVVNIYKGEHWILTQLHRRTRNISKGFIRALKTWIVLHEHKARELKK